MHFDRSQKNAKKAIKKIILIWQENFRILFWCFPERR